MELAPRILGAISIVLLAIGLADTDQVSAPVTTTTTTTTQTGDVEVVEPAPTTTTIHTAPGWTRCGQWWGLALELGWQQEQMETLDYIMWRESRCQPDAHNTTLNRDGSTDIGLTQINDKSWCLPTRWHPKGYLQRIGVLTKVGCEELFDPETNLKAARAIHDYAEKNYGSGFQPWRI